MEDFVTYEQAVQLKELGFDWKVRACYRRKLILDDNPHYTEPKFIHNDTMGKRWTTNYNDNRCGGGTGKYYYSAPILTQAQKWLREVKKSDILIDRENNSYIGVFWNPFMNTFQSIEKFSISGSDNFVSEIGMYDFDTYEECLSRGITQLLDLLTDKTEKK